MGEQRLGKRGRERTLLRLLPKSLPVATTSPTTQEMTFFLPLIFFNISAPPPTPLFWSCSKINGISLEYTLRTPPHPRNSKPCQINFSVLGCFRGYHTVQDPNWYNQTFKTNAKTRKTMQRHWHIGFKNYWLTLQFWWKVHSETSMSEQCSLSSSRIN